MIREPGKTDDISGSSVRIPVVDFARGIALVAMAIFHFSWDLEDFEIVREAMTLEPQWKYFARAIAASFLTLVGLGAWLAHHNGLALHSLIRRMLFVGGAALIITIATLYATPDGFIFFGILHNITLSSLLILLFLRLPIPVITICAIIVISAPWWARTSLLDHPVWWWSGLSQITPKANDYVPIFPWFGWVLVGLALAKIFSNWKVWSRLSHVTLDSHISILLQFFGRNSLIFYLVHQPVMIGAIYIFVKISS